MVPFILTAREIHGVASTQEYAEKHAFAIARLRERGMHYDVHESAIVLSAYINEGRWVVDCECGAGNAVDIDERVAYCFGCGAIHQSIVLPDDETRKSGESVLIDRPDVKTRHWNPQNESVADLQQENRERLDRLMPNGTGSGLGVD